MGFSSTPKRFDLVKFLSSSTVKSKMALLSVVILLTGLSSLKAQVTGTIFRDFNGNGTQQTVAPTIEPGISGVTVNAYNSADALLATTVTAANGTYTLAVGSSSVRIEYVLPSNCLVDPSVDFSGLMGSTFGSNVQFKTGGAGVTANFAVSNPGDYVNTTNPNFLINTYRNGNPLVLGGWAGGPAMYSAAYNNTGTTPTPTSVSTGAEIGSTWGIAYSKPFKKAFTSAYVKRHAGLGPGADPKFPIPANAPGSIYIIDPTGKTGTFFFSLDALGASYYTHNHTAGATLNVRSNTDRGLPAGLASSNTDATTYDQIGKVGIGGMDISDDGRYLFLVNLYDRKLYRIDLQNAASPVIPTAAQVTSYAIPNPNSGGGLNAGEFRPFAVKFYRGKVYVGGVTSGQTAASASAPSNASMNAYVYAFDAAALTFNTTALMTFPLSHARGTNTDGILENWRPWTNAFTPATIGSGSSYRGGLPQPMFTDIEIDGTGSVIVGFRDRFGDQSGYQNNNLAGTLLFSGFSYGDIYRGKINCAGTWTLESNGTANGITTAGAGNAQGPGGGEYYYQDNISTYQINNGLGGLAQLPGDVDVMTSIPDPINIWSQGVSKMRYTDGTNANDYEMETTAQSTTLIDGTFGKANGMGDVELMLDNPPIEIGNRVWNDLNADGIQEAGEAGVAGVSVLLFTNGADGIAGNADDVQVGTVTTNASGEFYFTSATGTDVTGTDYGVTINPNAGYNLRIGSASWANGATLGTGALANFGITIKDKVGAGQTDLSDNDAALNSNSVPMISFTTGKYGQNNHNLDFGFILKNLSLGNRVFLDKNRSGKYEPSDDPISFTTVHLYKDDNNDNVPDGAFIGVTMTDVNGFYSFVNLAPGNYIVGALIPAPLAITVINGGDPDNNTDEDNNGISIYNGEAIGNAITLTNGGEPTNGITNNTYDIGLYNPILPPDGGKVCFSGTSSIVWAKSTWTANVNDETVTIRTTFAKTFVDNTYGTSAIGWSGGHTFGNLTGSDNLTWSIRDANGVEKLKFQQDYISATTVSPAAPSGYTTLGFGGDGNNPTIGLASDVLSFRTSMDVNFNNYGYVLTTNSPATNTSYAPNANYPNWIFDVWYEVTVKKSAFGAAGFGFPVVASVHASPSKTGNNTEIVTQTPCGDGQIGDFVWNDANGNGIQDFGEAGIAGATVTLTKPDASTVVATTDANGFYLFDKLAIGTYTVTFTTPAGYSVTTSNTGANDAKDSDPVNGSVSVTLTDGQINLTIDAGFLLASLNLGNYVWNDQNNNGTQDASELAIAGATVNLYRDANGDNIADGAAIATTTTDANGIYGFTSLASGNYIVGVVLPAGYAAGSTTATSSTPNNDDNTDNNGVNTVAGEVRSNFITLSASGEPTTDGDDANGNLTLDFGLKGTGSIGDFVWNDYNGNGVQDLGEPGITGATVTLTYPNGATVSTTTDANGGYLFSNLAPGNYSVAFTTPSGFAATTSNFGDDAKDSDPVGGVVAVPLAAGQNNTTIDAGFVSSLLCVGNNVWNDQNNNGLKDAGEAGIAGATVNLYRDANNDNVVDGAAIATTTTDASGNYSFCSLTPGNYIVGVVIPTGYAPSTTNGGDPDNDTDNDNNGKNIVGTEVRGDAITLTTTGEPGGNTNNTYDFGLKGTGSIGDFVWNDLNGNGIQDAGEPGIAGVTVTLTYPNAATVSTTTDANGGYLFSNLAPGTYSVAFTAPVGFTVSPSNQGADDAKDSDPIGGVVSGIVLNAGQNNLTIDAGFQCNIMNIGNYVWNDQNNNGTQDAGEPTIANATVKLYASNGTTLLATTTTDATGIYGFVGLTPGDYIVGVTIPVGYVAGVTTATSANPNNDNNTDNNGVIVIGAEVRSNVITLIGSSEPTTDGDGNNGNLTLDFGLKGTGSIGDFVWNDTNGNGVQDAGEAGIPGVTVTLTYPNGATVSTTTDANGGYLFSNLAPGGYSVTFTTPSGYTAAPSNQGGDDTKDSDPVGGVVSGITLSAGQNNTTVDAGYRQCPGLPSAPGVAVCYGTPATLTATGATGASFAWYDAPTGGNLLSTSATFVTSNITVPVTYYVQQTIGGVCGASGRTAVNVTVTALPISGINGPASICAGEGALFFANGAGTGATYAWTFDGATPATAAGPSATPVYDLPGEYEVTLVVYKNGCSVTYKSTIVITQSVFAAAGPDQDLCLGASTNIAGNGPVGANFTWTVVAGDPTSIDNGANSKTVSVSPLVTTTYRLTVTQNGCTRTDEIVVFVNVNKNPTADAGQNKTTCAGVPVTIGGNPTGTPPLAMPNAPLGYVWTGTGLNSNDIANPTVSITTPGVYDYRVIVYNMLTGCSDTAFVQVNVQQCYDLGNSVWYDKNNNGLQEAATENGIGGVVVKLYDCSGNYLNKTTTTDINGNYKFNLVPAGNYIVGITTPTGYLKADVASTNVSVDNQNDGVNVVSTEIRTNCFPLTASTDNIDFGLKGSGSIGDYVWNDFNANGVQDDGEPGIGGATVTLTYPSGNQISVLTDSKTGLYLFSNLAPGTYTVTFVTPSGMVPTPSNQGADDAVDSDPINGTVTGIALSAGQSILTIDAGFFTPIGSIGDKVWNDANRNGIQDASEIGVAGVTVTLYNNAGTVLSTTITDAYGYYKFTNLPVALGGTNYQVRFSLPAQYQFSSKDQGGDDTKDSDADVITGKTGIITLTPANKDRSDVDAGINYTIPAKIGDFIWNDINKDGFQDPNEPGIAGVTVTLYDNAGIPVMSTITDNNGHYQFTDVPVGTYTLGVSAPIGFNASPKDASADDAKDSDFDPTTFKTEPFNVTYGTTNLTFDGGFFAAPLNLASVGDKVWNDLNGNSLQDANEPGVQGVKVELFTSAGVLVATTTTDAFGYYIFSSLAPGAYYVKFSDIPAGYAVVTPNVGGLANVAIDSDITGANGTGTTPTFTLLPGQSKVTVDAGVRNSSVTNNSTLGDYVWYDLNKNGVQDAAEVAGVPGVTVTLYNAATSAVIKTTTTDANGKYLFTDLAIGTYVVGFSNLPTGYVLTSKDAGADDSKDNDADATTGRTDIYSILADGTNILTVDAGIISNPNVRDGKATLGDKVWNDIDGDGIQDANEPGIAGVTVVLYAGNGTSVIGTTTTDGLGNYIFTNLDAGSYVVGFSGFPSGYVLTTSKAGTDATVDSDPSTITGKTNAITLVAGEVNTTIDAGLIAINPKSSLGDRVWFDNNGNGIQDAGEPGVAGVSVSLFDLAANLIKTTATNTNGNYLFTDLEAGSYVIVFNNLPTGYFPTTQNAAGSNSTNNSDANFSGITGTIVLPASATDLTWDMGILSNNKASVGDYVWNDANNNGIQDASEKGVGGITVTLYDNTGAAVTNTVTDANGYYNFSNVIPGTYTIGFSNIPANSGFTTKNAVGSTAANNSDVNSATGITDAFVLVGGQVKTDVDAGLISTFAAVGDYVWYDINFNGKQDANEPGVPGVVVTLYNASNVKVASAVTDGDGYYFINNIPVSGTTNFTMGFTNTPINTEGFTIKNAPGTTSANNSDVNPGSGRTDVFTLAPNQIRLDIDAGIITTSGGPLPVTLVNLAGVYANGVAQLNWATLTELNSDRFELEYSIDGITFSNIKNIAAAGNSSTRIDYTYAHNQLKVGANYYRLKMIDRDGRSTYSNIVVLNVAAQGIAITGIYPNPFIDRVNISVTTGTSEVVKIKIYNAAGQVIRDQQSSVRSGVNNITVNNLSTLARGTYIVEVRTTDKVLTQRLIK
ncbi:SdrD B-like domain-containing protein [Ferruginibacter sp. SUN002]|uniref:SdrD B-like domain-containing protein n=1 Tax=Ferruginibacter sp. SUN002 TaxID=2937789 RepID=UPI003D36FC2A